MPSVPPTWPPSEHTCTKTPERCLRMTASAALVTLTTTEEVGVELSPEIDVGHLVTSHTLDSDMISPWFGWGRCASDGRPRPRHQGRTLGRPLGLRITP
jgi:hypothetical protein